MAAANRPARLNRTLIAVIGLVLLAAGVLAAAASLGRLPVFTPTSPLLTVVSPAPVWLSWVGGIAAVLVGLLCLRWLLAQAQRRPKTGTWALPRPAGAHAGPHGETRIGASTAIDPLLDDIESYRGVHGAKAYLTGEHRRPALYLEVTVDVDAELADLRRSIDTHALPRLARALDLPDIPAHLLLRVHPATTARVT